MAWGDHTRAENKIDEQQKIAQGYNTGVQQNIGNQYGANNSLYWGGGGAPQYGQTYGYGSTVPSYSQYGGSAFQGNGTGTQSFSPTGTGWTPSGGFGSVPGAPGAAGQSQIGGGGGGDLQAQFNALFPGNTLSSADLIAHEQDLANMGVRLMGPNARGERTKIMLPDGRSVDLIHGAGAGSGTGTKQWLIEGGGGGGGGGGLGQYGAGGIPGMALNDYGGIMGLYGGMVGSAEDMAKTGGLSEQDKANLRARAISPIRSVYSQGLQNVERQRSLQGGYSPGFTTAMGRFNREQGQLTSDATTNAEAAIAELVQRGKLGGLGAWAQGLGGMSSLYGTQPGMAKMFGDQLNDQMHNQLAAGGLQNQLSNSIMQNTNYMGANIKGNLDTGLNTAKTAGSMASGAMTPWVRDQMGNLFKRDQNGQFRPYNPATDNPPAYGDPNYTPGTGYPNAENAGPYGGITPVSNYYGSPDSSYVPGYENDPSGGMPPGQYMPYDPNNPQYQL